MGDEPPTDAKLVVVSHSGARAGAPMVLLRFLGWLDHNTTIQTKVVLLHGGTMEEEFMAFDARIVGGTRSRLWMLQRGFTNLGLNRTATALAFARQGPTMWAARGAQLILLNSAGSLPAVRFLPKHPGSKLVLYVHELDEGFDRTLGSSAWSLLSPRIDHFLTCSNAVTEMLCERKGVPPRLVSEHHGFVDRPTVDPSRSTELRRELGIPPEALVVGASGSPEWRKGPELFVRVAARLRAARPDLDVHFLWLGGPIDSSPGWKILHDVTASGLDDRFHLAGEVETPLEVMALFDVFVLTSREDPYPLAMIEAASLGVPMVSFDQGGAAQFAREGRDGRSATLVPYLDVPAMTDAVTDLLDQPDQRRSLGERARAQIETTHLTEQAAPQLLQTLIDVEPRLATGWDAGSLRAPSSFHG